MKGSPRAPHAVTLLKFTVLCQFILRAVRIFPAFTEATRNSYSLLMSRVWVGAGFNLILFMISSHASELQSLIVAVRSWQHCHRTEYAVVHLSFRWSERSGTYLRWGEPWIAGRAPVNDIPDVRLRLCTVLDLQTSWATKAFWTSNVPWSSYRKNSLSISGYTFPLSKQISSDRPISFSRSAIAFGGGFGT